MTTEAVSDPITTLPTKSRVGNQHFAPAVAIIERAGGFDHVLELIRSRQSHREICQSLGIGHASLCRYLSDESRVQETRQAMADSAEAWSDRGMLALEEAAGKDNAEVQRARAIAQECARRAAIRNPRFSEKHAVEVSGSVQTAQAVVHVFIPDNGRDKPIDNDG